jgi:hypothetical protein
MLDAALKTGHSSSLPFGVIRPAADAATLQRQGRVLTQSGALQSNKCERWQAS